MEKKQNTERNNKGGRPPKSTTDKLKYRITVKLATPDYYTLKSRARSAGISASEYLRECFRKGYVRQRLTEDLQRNIPTISVSYAVWRTIWTSWLIRQMPEDSRRQSWNAVYRWQESKNCWTISCYDCQDWIAKIVKGSGFREVTGYIIDSKKDARIIAHAGLFIEDVDTITKAFEAQAGMNPKVSRPVGHIALGFSKLGFSKEDESRLTSRIMAEIALEYMGRMGIRNTQFFIARHFDKEHPHIHIAYNRIDNDGRTISDKNERIRSTRICKELTKKYNLYWKSRTRPSTGFTPSLNRRFQGVETGTFLPLIWRNKAWKFSSSTRASRTRCRV